MYYFTLKVIFKVKIQFGHKRTLGGPLELLRINYTNRIKTSKSLTKKYLFKMEIYLIIKEIFILGLTQSLKNIVITFTEFITC
jgi:hypothetical protein